MKGLRMIENRTIFFTIKIKEDRMIDNIQQYTAKRSQINKKL